MADINSLLLARIISTDPTILLIWVIGIVLGLTFIVLIWMALVRFVKLTGHLNQFFSDLEDSNTSLSKIVIDRTYMLSVLSEIEKNRFEKDIK